MKKSEDNLRGLVDTMRTIIGVLEGEERKGQKSIQKIIC